jgi:AcrR family transcriptional regulator
MNERTFRSRRGRKGTARAGKDLPTRERILRAAEELFAAQGFAATTARQIADRAGFALGNMYNYFATKEDIFDAVMVGLARRYHSPDEPLQRVLRDMTFPEDLEKMGEAIGDSFERFDSYVRLVYVDVLEFKGAHLARIYKGMNEQFRGLFAKRFAEARRRGALTKEIDPTLAVVLAFTSYSFYFTVEHTFGVRGHLGPDRRRVIHEFAKIIRRGVRP